MILVIASRSFLTIFLTILNPVLVQGGCKKVVFKVKFEGKALQNHVFQTNKSVSQDSCGVLCYLDDRCLSYNYGTSADGQKNMCELSESDHVIHGEDLANRPDTAYLRAENNCQCQKDQTCRYNFLDNSHYCVCKTNSNIPCDNGGGSTASSSKASMGLAGGASTGSPGGASTGSPGEASTGSPGGASTGFPGGASTGFPGGASTGFPGGASTGFPGVASTRSPSTSTGSSGAGSTENPTTMLTTQPQTTTASSSGSDCDLQFTTASTSNMIRIRGAFPTAPQEFTISFWLQIPSSSVTLYPFSYATNSQTSALSVAIKEDSNEIEVGLNGGGKTIESFLVRNNNWQHFVVTWKSSTGDVKLYYNGGAQNSQETGLAQGETFPTGGTIIIGQQQGGFESGFDATKTMEGNIADLNFWSSAYTAAQVSTLFTQGCGVAAGDVLSWATILQGEVIGSLPRTCPATCKKP